MSIVASGPAAAFVGTALQEGAWRLVMTAPAPGLGEYELTLTETLHGYSNSPRATTFMLVVEEDGPIILTTAVNPPEVQTACLKSEPDGAADLTRSRDPGDTLPLWTDFTDVMPPGTFIGTIEWIGFDDASGGQVGMELATGRLRPAFRREQHLMRTHPRCAPEYQQSAQFAGAGKKVALRHRLALWDAQGQDTGLKLEMSTTYFVRQR